MFSRASAQSCTFQMTLSAFLVTNLAQLPKRTFRELIVQDFYAIPVLRTESYCYSVLKACDGLVEAAR